MEKSIIPTFTNELYISHAEFQGCFIKIWTNFYSKKRVNMENGLQEFKNFTEEFTNLDLYGNTLYVYVWKTDNEVRVYRCQVMCSDLVAKTHTILLIDYGQKMVVPFIDVRKVTKDLDQSYLIGLSQRAAVYTFLLTGYISKPKSNTQLVNVLCNKYYKYRHDFEIGGISFVSLIDDDKKLIDHGLADTVDVATTFTIANSMVSIIASNNKNDLPNNFPIASKTPTSKSFLMPQHLDCVTLIDVVVTRVSISDNFVLLTVRTIDNDSETINNILNSIDRKNLKLAPIIDVFTPCLIVFQNKLVRAIILEVKIDRLFIDLVDYGIREYVTRTVVFEIPPKCHVIEMRSLNVILDKPNDAMIDKNMFIQKYFQMLPLKMDPSFGLYKVKLFKKKHEEVMDVCDLFNSTEIDSSITNNLYSIPSKSPELFSITEINEEMQSTDNSMGNCATSLNNLNNKQIKSIDVEPRLSENENPLKLKDKEYDYCITKHNERREREHANQIVPIMFLRKEHLKEDSKEIVGSLIYYKSPYNFRIRQYNQDFEYFMDQIKSVLESRRLLTKFELVKNMHVIYQNQLHFIYRAQIIDMDSEVEKIKLQLVDEGDEIINENFNKITLYNFIESDCNLPRQLVLDCSLSNMWFPIISVDTLLLIQPYFNKKILYTVKIIKSDESGVKSVQMFNKNTNVDISDTILKSGIGQRLVSAMKTDESPYEENLLIGQSFLSYVYHYHFNLCIQPEPNTVNELEEEIFEYIKENPNFEPLEQDNLRGTYCLATVNYDQWYRAYIKNTNEEESIIVNMFDIGLLTDVSLKQIRPITSSLMRKPQLCINCSLENTDFDLKITEKTLYNVIVKSVTVNGKLCVSIKEHQTAPLNNPIVRSIEKISFVHVDGDICYLQRSQDHLKAEKMSEILSKLNGKLENKSAIAPGDVHIFENHGTYYRCVVKSTNSKMAVVHCIDFGFEKQIEKKKLQYLGQSKFALLPALVIAVKTFPMAFNMSKSTFLTDMHVDHDGALIATPYITSLLHSQNELMKTLENGCLVKVTCVYSNDDCWIVPHLFFDRLQTISDILVKMQSKIIPDVTEVGSLCAALHSKTKKWHRALILDEGIENMLSIDSGERFKALKTTKLVTKIQNIPNCALRCQVISNISVQKLLNKDVKCKLISCDQPLLEVELFFDEIDKNEIITSQSIIKWTVVICKFESFNEFYVKKVDDKFSSDNCNLNELLTSDADNLEDFTQQPSVGTLVAALTDRGDGLWYKAEILVIDHNDINGAIVRISSDGNICKSIQLKVLPDYMTPSGKVYRCCLEEEIKDNNIINNLPTISLMIMMYLWTMTTSSDSEPYTVTLTEKGQDCIEKLLNILSTDKCSELPKKEVSMSSVKPNNKPLVEIPAFENKNITEIDLVLPKVEKVIIKYFNSFRYFYCYSESLYMLYMKRINDDLDECIIKLPLNKCMTGSIVVTCSETLDCWCRAKIEEITLNKDSAQCYLLDYGISEKCTEFYKPSDFLYFCPPIFRRCALYTPQLDGKENEIWFPNVDEMFKDILTIENVTFNMTVISDGDPCVVALRLEEDDISEMLNPLIVRVSYINSFTQFVVSTMSNDQKVVADLLQSGKVSMELIENPIKGNLYLAEINSILKRVKFDTMCGIKFVVQDVDNTLEVLSVDKLYKGSENICNVGIFTMECSLIFNDEEENMYSLSMFQKLADAEIDLIMCIITESDGKTPNLVKLYIDNKDVLDFIRLK